MNVVISGPSGAGKGSIIRELKDSSSFVKSVSYTTRKMRENEVPGWDYHYRTKEEFMELKKQDFFFEIAEYDGNFYGIPRQNISSISEQKNTIFDLIPSSGLNIKRNFDNTCLIYVIPPNEEILTLRRGDRGDTRIIRDIEQLEFVKNNYDYLIINNNLEDSMNDLYNIINIFQKYSISNNQLFLDNYFPGKNPVKKRVRI